MPLDTALAKSVPASLRRSALFTRFTTPLASRNRHVTEFYVEPEDPWKSFSPGETVKGCVTLTVTKPLPITHLVICLHGSARVYKNQVVPSEAAATSGFLGPGRGKRGVEYLGNGFASLFEDEAVLCGEGLLKKGIYKFKFELSFPPHRLPSSIDFERGTVSYYVTATVTRPTTIAPTFSRDRRINFQDSIDVGDIPIPRARVISLEPVSSRSISKAKVKQTSIEAVPRISTQNEMRNSGLGNVHLTSPSLGDDPPLSPVPSERSSASVATTSSQSFQIVHQSSPAASASTRNNDSRSSRTSTPPDTITASTELLKPGALPGDIVPLRILIHHSKPNARGLIIVTLYRQGRIDMHPQMPVTSRNKGKKPEYEDVYPRSRTGLSGLQFSNSSLSSLFRMDLNQTSAIMVVNPSTLTSDMKTSVRIPDDAFPTMSNVPGGMIEFKYYVEVVMDLCGKLGESRLLPRISLTSTPQNFTSTAKQENGLTLTSDWAGNILDTTQLRRVKGIVSCLFEVVVGSRASTKSSKKPVQEVPINSYSPHHDHANEQDWGDRGYWDENVYHDPHLEAHDRPYDQRDWAAEQQVPRFVPPPEPEEEVDEKTRLRRQEALLLPSQPPEETDQPAHSSSAPETSIPTAPFIYEEGDYYGHHAPTSPAGPTYTNHIQHSATSTRSVDTVVPSYSATEAGPSTSTAGPSSPPPVEDKQELERQRLLVEASAPSAQEHSENENENGIAGPSAPSPSTEPARDQADPSAEPPSAPALREEDEYNVHTLHTTQGAGDHLPEYQR